MVRAIPWSERSFDFSFPVRLAREIMSRLEGMPARAEWLVRPVASSVATRRVGSGWSILENVGHLADTDRDLFIPRLDQFEAGAERLRPADMTNRATWGARHNERPIDEVLSEVRERRLAIVARLGGYDEAFLARTALHPRLGTPMRVVDLCFFKAEHDDYHLARVRELRRELG
jgi:hypothetical protein